MNKTIYCLEGDPPNTTILMLLGVFASLGCVMVGPALPEISHYFSITNAQSQLIISLYLFGYAAGELIYGPFQNRFGRIPTLKAGLCVAILGSVLSVLSSSLASFPLLLVGRFIEAIGCSAGLVFCFTIINEFYYPEQAKKIFLNFATMLAIVPGVGILLGGLISEYIGWQGCFYFLLAYNGLLLVFTFLLRETLITKDLQALFVKNIVAHYSNAAKNRNIIVFGLILGCFISFIYVFSAEGPYIGIKLLGLSPSVFGILAALLGVGMLLGVWVGSILVKKNSSRKMLLIGLALAMVSILALLCLFLFNYVSVYTLLCPVFFLYFSTALIFPSGSSIILATFKDKSNGSSFGNFIMIGTPTLVTTLVSFFHSGNPVLLPLVYLLLIVVVTLLVFFGHGSYQ